MNASHIKFIREELIPFIKRDQGRGFGMEHWKYSFQRRKKIDGIVRTPPKCKTVACIGGSIDLLRNEPYKLSSADVWFYRWRHASELIGLTEHQADVLFYRWRHGWPEPFRKRYAKSKTTRGKAKVACDLLEQVCKTKGRCLA